jgi:hypothetical protein
VYTTATTTTTAAAAMATTIFNVLHKFCEFKGVTVLQFDAILSISPQIW